MRSIKFTNHHHKKKFIIDVIALGERVSLHELLNRLAAKGYRPNRQELAMFIRNNLLHRYLKAEKGARVTLYRRIQ